MGGEQGWDPRGQILGWLGQRYCHYRGLDSTTSHFPPSLVKSARHWEVDANQGHNSKKIQLRVHFAANLAPAKANEEPVTTSDLLKNNSSKESFRNIV